ncbi:MAG: PEGA domain-containing protein [ANME-2 cluster archaeon]|nr:MAG: PEGA domain-containing protein [ANME-2 cluster archaeon]
MLLIFLNSICIVEAGTPEVEISTAISNSQIQAGDSAILTVTVSEVGGDDWVKNPTVSISISPNNGISLTETSKTASRIDKSSSISFSFPINILKTATVGSKTIQITLEYYEMDFLNIDTYGPFYKSTSKTFYIINSYGSVSVSSMPSGSNVYLDGSFIGITPLTTSDIPVESHTIKLSKSEFNDISKTIIVNSGQTAYVSENLKSTITSQPTVAVTAYSPTSEKMMSNENNNTILPIIFLFIILTLLFIITRRKKSTDSANNYNSPTPSKSAQSSVKQTTPLAATTTIIEKPIDKGTIDIKSAFQYKGAIIQYKVKIINQTPEPISDIKIQLFVPEVFMLTEKEKFIPMLEPDESKTATFDIRPTGECGDCVVSGRINYYDYITKKRQDLDIEKKMVSIICPVLKRKEIDEDGWRLATQELIKAEENTKDLDIPGENLFNIVTRVLKDMNMFMISPEITSTPQLFTGVAMLYAEGAAGLRYAAYIEVVGGRKSRMILKAWAEKEEALTGFYHRILDEIEKRTDIKMFINDGIIQYNTNNTVVRDNIIQRSNIDLGNRSHCHECGRKVEGDEKFCLGCGAKLGGNT